MTKLVRKNYNQEQSLQGYNTACACLCAVCTCKVINLLSIGSNNASNGLNVDNATSTAHNYYC